MCGCRSDLWVLHSATADSPHALHSLVGGGEAVPWSLYGSKHVKWMQDPVPRWHQIKLKTVLGFRTNSCTACFFHTLKLTRPPALLQSN